MFLKLPDLFKASIAAEELQVVFIEAGIVTIGSMAHYLIEFLWLVLLFP